MSDPQLPLSNDEGLSNLEASIEDLFANTPQYAIVGTSLNEDAVELNVETIFVLDLSDDVSFEQLQSSLEFAVNYIKEVK